MRHDRGGTFCYTFHIFGHLVPSYAPVAKAFYEPQKAMFIVDLSKLETVGP